MKWWLIYILLLGCEIPIQAHNNDVNISITPTILHRSNMPTTSFSFSLHTTSDVNIVVYGKLGNEVAILVDEFMAAGLYSVTWDASLQSTGIYFVQMVSNGFI